MLGDGEGQVIFRVEARSVLRKKHCRRRSEAGRQVQVQRPNVTPSGKPWPDCFPGISGSS